MFSVAFIWIHLWASQWFVEINSIPLGDPDVENVVYISRIRFELMLLHTDGHPDFVLCNPVLRNQARDARYDFVLCNAEWLTWYEQSLPPVLWRLFP